MNSIIEIRSNSVKLILNVESCYFVYALNIVIGMPFECTIWQACRCVRFDSVRTKLLVEKFMVEAKSRGDKIPCLFFSSLYCWNIHIQQRKVSAAWVHLNQWFVDNLIIWTSNTQPSNSGGKHTHAKINRKNMMFSFYSLATWGFR